MSNLQRKSGLLLPIFSLPSPYGIGTFGKEAYEFIDFLEKAGQSYWQILPLNPTGFGDSPYQSFSAFALNPLMIDLPSLWESGLLLSEELRESGLVNNEDRVEYGNLYGPIYSVLKKVALRVSSEDPELLKFIDKEQHWLLDYSLFMVIKSKYDMKPLWEWPDNLRLSGEESREDLRRELGTEVHFWNVVQFLLAGQWSKLKGYAEGKEIKIIGDMPIYVASDSVDFWTHLELFQIDEGRRVRKVAGCPPDEFCLQGQRWGNPLYRWDAHKKTGYKWWVQRLINAENNYHGVRLDHFRGLAGYYAIPAEVETGEKGNWEKGPGMNFIKAIRKELPSFLIIAENLGHLTKDVEKLLESSGLPGMKVLQFAFEPGKDSIYLPHKYEENCVVYTGTHDNNTLKGWVMNASPQELALALKYTGATKLDQLPQKLIDIAMKSNANLCIIPIQDWLGLGEEYRTNIPGSTQGNWVYRLRPEALSDDLAKKIRRQTKNTGRT